MIELKITTEGMKAHTNIFISNDVTNIEIANVICEMEDIKLRLLEERIPEYEIESDGSDEDDGDDEK